MRKRSISERVEMFALTCRVRLDIWMMQLLGGALIAGAVACVGGKLTQMSEALLLGGARIACAEEGAVPAVGPALVLACPGEEALLKDALDKVTAQPGPTVAASVATAPDAGAGAGRVPLVRFAANGQAVHCGWAHPDIAAAMQAALLVPGKWSAIGDGGADASPDGAEGGAK